MSIYFTPTWLYIKQHNKTGLKYFGKTTKNPYIYKGSGVYWTRHLLSHGNDVTTLWAHLYLNKLEITEDALAFSKSHGIAESTEWANLKEENGLDGGGSLSEIVKEKIREKRKLQICSEETREKLRKRVITDENRRKKSDSLKEAYSSGRRSMSDEHKEIIKRTHTGRKQSEETKSKIRAARALQDMSSRKGVSHSIETKRKISESQKARYLRR